MKKIIRDKVKLKELPKIFFFLSLCLLSFGYGFIAYHYEIFPYKFIREAKIGMDFVIESISTDEEDVYYREDYYRETDYEKIIPIYEKNAAYNGLSLVTSIVEERSLSVRIIDMEGKLIHEWDIDWFEIWPDATHIPKSDQLYPNSRPGTHIHGAELLDDGDLVFNFENLGLVRLDVCSNIVWRLPQRTHHSIYRDEYDNLWIPGNRFHDEPLPNFPNYKPPFVEPTILKISLEGDVLDEISLLKILKQNDLMGLLLLSSLDNTYTKVTGDTLHLNDIETFPSYLEEGAFQHGDIMVSLRNINAVLILRPPELAVTYMSIGEFVRQHDPDFIDGNTISIFDNYNIVSDGENEPQSRILLRSFKDNQSNIYYTGDEENPFFTDIMGKHEWLPNENVLITETMKGKAFEIDQQGKIVWEYVNIVDEGFVGIVEEVHRLPSEYDEEFFEQRTQDCGVTK